MIALTILFILIGIVGYTYYRSRKLFGPGESIEETANILVYDFKFGYRAKKKAVQYGDAILPILQQKTNNFANLGHINSFLFAWLLGEIQTECSRAILTELYSRTDIYARLVGAVGLAQHDAFPDVIDENSFLVKVVETNSNDSKILLAIWALGLTQKQEATPCLLELLKKRDIGSSHTYACVAIARIRASDAIPVLRDCLRSTEFYALPGAFRALITLGDREAIPLAIARITTDLSKSNRGRLVKELQRVTGQPYGHYPIFWNLWWRFVGGWWQIPEAFRKSWDEQKKNSATITMNAFAAFLLTFLFLVDRLIHRCKHSRTISSITNTNFFKS